MIITEFSKMLVAVSSIGIYITQENGHRYIHVDVRELSNSHPNALSRDEFKNVSVGDELSDPIWIIKHYGSYLTALQRVESWLGVSLSDIFDNLNYANTIVGTAEVE